MKNFKSTISAAILTLAISATAFGGTISTTVAGTISTTKSTGGTISTTQSTAGTISTTSADTMTSLDIVEYIATLLMPW